MNLLQRRIILLTLLIGFILPFNGFTASTAQSSEHIGITQLEPDITINSLVLSNNLPEEGEVITAIMTVENKDNVEFMNLLIQLNLVPARDGRDDGGDDIPIGNEMIQQLGPLETSVIELTFTAPAGEYDVVAIIIFNNLPVQNSKTSVSIQVLSPKVGDNQTPLLAIIVFILFFIILLFGQATYDAFKLKDVNLDTNGQ